MDKGEGWKREYFSTLERTPPASDEEGGSLAEERAHIWTLTVKYKKLITSKVTEEIPHTYLSLNLPCFGGFNKAQCLDVTFAVVRVHVRTLKADVTCMSNLAGALSYSIDCCGSKVIYLENGNIFALPASKVFYPGSWAVFIDNCQNSVRVTIMLQIGSYITCFV
jgi:hypothetical protein